MIREELDGPLDRQDLVGQRPAAEARGVQPEPGPVDLLDAVGFEPAFAINDLVFDFELEVPIFLHNALTDPTAVSRLLGKRTCRCDRRQSQRHDPDGRSTPAHPHQARDQSVHPRTLSIEAVPGPSSLSAEIPRSSPESEDNIVAQSRAM